MGVRSMSRRGAGQLGDLVRQGILTDEEFAAQKTRVLGR